MANLRILHIISSSGFYGAERVLLSQLKSMPAARHSVLVYGQASGFSEKLAQEQVPCIIRHSGPFKQARDFLTLMKAIIEFQPDILHCHGNKEVVMGALAGTLYAKPVVMTQHGFTNRSKKGKLYTYLGKQVCRWGRVKSVICVSQSIKAIYQSTGVSEQKLVLMQNAISISDQALPVNRDPETIVFVGRLSHEKGPDLFLRVMETLLRQGCTVRGLLIGDGPLRTILEKSHVKLAPYVTFLGYQEQVSNYLKSASLLAITSRTEGIPLVMLEAMDLNVPVVAFRVGGVAEVLEHGKTGILCTPQDTNEMAASIQKLLQNDNLQKRITRSARQTLIENHNLNEQAHRLLHIYQALV